MTESCGCGGHLKYEFTAQSLDNTHKVYKCELCGKSVAKITYVYKPSSCPKHHWEMVGWRFEDGPDKHEIYWDMVCDRCGAKRKERFDSEAVGCRQAVDVEDPRVLKNLALDKHSARFLLPDDDVQDFWKD